MFHDVTDLSVLVHIQILDRKLQVNNRYRGTIYNSFQYQSQRTVQWM